MGFETPQPLLSDYLKWTNSGKVQLPDFQRGYKWEDERIRSLLVTVLRGHPLGVVMMLTTGNDQIRFKPRPVEGTSVPAGTVPRSLLLDGQQRLTSLTQALTGAGVVSTKDNRGKLFDRCYYVDIELTLQGDDRVDEAVLSVPADRMIRSNFGKDIDRDLSTDERERESGLFPLRLLLDPMRASLWLADLPDRQQMAQFMERIIGPVNAYTIPAIQLDETTSKAAVATVFEKVNTGGLSLNVFELLTATFAGDKSYYDRTGSDFRLNDDWHATQETFAAYPVLAEVESTDFLQAVTLLATRNRQQKSTETRRPAISAKREDILKVTLDDYLAWVEPLRAAFVWSSTFLADHHIFGTRFLPYPKQLVSLAVIRVVLGKDADLHGVRQRLSQWFWCGILGELYSGTIETRFVRDIEQVPAWARGDAEAALPRTVQDSTFVESRLHSLRTRNAAAYKGIYALILNHGARDWMHDQSLDKVQYTDLAVDIHHVFPQKWCDDNDIYVEDRESIINKTPLAASTNRAIGGVAPSLYLPRVESKAGIDSSTLAEIIGTHGVDMDLLAADDFEGFFGARREALVSMIERATGRPVQRDVESGELEEGSDQFEPEDAAIEQDL